MGTVKQRQTKKVAGSVEMLNQSPTEEMMLRVRNLSKNNLVFANGGSEIFIGVKGEVVVPPTWAKHRQLRKSLEKQEIEVEWVDGDYAPRAIPDADDAPENARVESNFDKAYAREIALTDTEAAVRLVKVEVKDRETGGPDARFFKIRFATTLRLARWMETQLDNRKPVLKAIDDRLTEIKTM